MAQYQCNVDRDLVQAFFRDKDAAVEVLAPILNEFLKLEATEQAQAEPYERTDRRRCYRNGYRSRRIMTRVGPIELEVPRLRTGQFSTELFDRYQRSEQALVLAMMEMVVNGVSTRKVRRITEELCGTSFSRSTVSTLCRRLDELVTAWNKRDLSGQAFPFVIMDAIYLKARVGGRVVSQSALLALGVDADGHRRILGIKVGDSESEASWSEYLVWLKDRGLRGVELVVSDDHRGLVQAIRRHLQGASWQRCQTHLKRNVLDACPKALQGDLAGKLRLLFDAPDLATARRLLQDILTEYQGRARRAMDCLEGGLEDAVAVMHLPHPYRKRLRSTNVLERLNQEIRRRDEWSAYSPTHSRPYACWERSSWNRMRPGPRGAGTSTCNHSGSGNGPERTKERQRLRSNEVKPLKRR